MTTSIQQSENAVRQTYENFVYCAELKRILFCKTDKVTYITENNNLTTKRFYLN